MADADRHSEAVENCREAVRLDPTRAGYRAQLAYLYMMNERGAEALQLLESADLQAQNSIFVLGTQADAYYAIISGGVERRKPSNGGIDVGRSNRFYI